MLYKLLYSFNNSGETQEFQLSCFLHDIGHLLLDEHNNNNNFLKKI